MKLVKTMKMKIMAIFFLINRASTSNSNLHFKEDVYEGRLRDIDIYLNTLKRQES